MAYLMSITLEPTSRFTLRNRMGLPFVNERLSTSKWSNSISAMSDRRMVASPRLSTISSRSWSRSCVITSYSIHYTKLYDRVHGKGESGVASA